MSVEIVKTVREHSKQKRAGRAVLLEIAEHARPYGLAWPSLTRLSEATGLTTRSVINHVKRLEESGELIVYRRRGRHNFYIVSIGISRENLEACAKKISHVTGEEEEDVWRNLVPWSDAGEDIAHAGVAVRGEKISPVKNFHQCSFFTGPVKNFHGTSEKTSPEPITEPKTEPIIYDGTLADARGAANGANTPPTGSNGSGTGGRRNETQRSEAERALMGAVIDQGWTRSQSKAWVVVDVFREVVPDADANSLESFAKWYRKTHPELALPLAPEKVRAWVGSWYEKCQEQERIEKEMSERTRQAELIAKMLGFEF